MNANQVGLVPLGQELQIVRDYLEIEKTRFRTRLRYSIDVPPELAEVGVPPLSIESLVENSIKHVIAQRPEGGEIHVTGTSQADRMVLEVRDDGAGFSMGSVPEGHGLENLASRLTLLFGPEAYIESARDGKHSSVRVVLPRTVDPK